MKSQVLLTIIVLVLPWCSSSPTRPPSPDASTTTISSSPTRSPSSSSSSSSRSPSSSSTSTSSSTSPNSVYKSEVVDIKSSSGNGSSTQSQKPFFNFKIILDRLPDIQRTINNITGNLANGERIKSLIKSFTPTLKTIMQAIAKINGVALNEKNLKGIEALIDLLPMLFEPGAKFLSPPGTTNALLKDYTHLLQQDTPQTQEDYADTGDITHEAKVVDGPRNHITTLDVRKSSSSPSPKSLSSSTSGTLQQRQQQPPTPQRRQQQQQPQRRQQPTPTPPKQQQLTPTPTTSPIQKARVVQVRVGGVEPSEIPRRRTLLRLNRPSIIPKSPSIASSRLLFLHDTEARESKVAKVKQNPITGRPRGLIPGQRRRPFFGARRISRKQLPSHNNKHITATNTQTSSTNKHTTPTTTNTQTASTNKHTTPITTNTELEHINKHTEPEHINKHTPSTNTKSSHTNKDITTTNTQTPHTNKYTPATNTESSPTNKHTATKTTNTQTPESNTRSNSATKTTTTTTTGERESRRRPNNQRRSRIPSRRRSGITSRGRQISK